MIAVNRSVIGWAVPIAYITLRIAARSEPDILVVLNKSVSSVTLSIGEISFSLLERLEARVGSYCIST